MFYEAVRVKAFADAQKHVVTMLFSDVNQKLTIYIYNCYS